MARMIITQDDGTVMEVAQIPEHLLDEALEYALSLDAEAGSPLTLAEADEEVE